MYIIITLPFICTGVTLGITMTAERKLCYVPEQGAEESTWGSNGKSNNETEKKLSYDDPHYLYGDHIKMHEMGETCGTHECVLGFGERGER